MKDNKAVLFLVLLLGFLFLMLFLAPVALGLAIMGGKGSDDECKDGGSASIANRNVTYAVGDSIMVGMDEALKANIKGRVTVNGQVGRNVKQGLEAIQADKGAIENAGVVVIELGTNKSPDFAEDARKLVEKVYNINPSVSIHWVEIFSKGDYSAENQAIKKLDRVSVIRMKGKKIDMSGDEIHPTPEGYKQAARIVARAAGAGAEAENQKGDSKKCESGKSAGRGGKVSGSVRELAKQLLASKNVSYPLAGERTRGVLVSLSKGEKAATTCENAGGVRTGVSPKLLSFLVDLSDLRPIGINAITDGCHTGGSNHYSGKAVDFECGAVPFDDTVAGRIAAKYGGHNNGETCASTNHSHYDFL